MKEQELRTRATCCVCNEKIGNAHPLGLFFKVTIERLMIDVNACRRQTGLEMLIGNVGIAQAMGQDEDLAKTVMEPVTVTVCETCALETDPSRMAGTGSVVFAAAMDVAAKRDAEAEATS